MPKTNSDRIEIGARFNKTGDPLGKVWEVVKVSQGVVGIPHARLRSCEPQGSDITIAAGVLADPVFWRPAQED